jgi:ParB family transcriptional regulator, chromosome partitioning protein
MIRDVQINTNIEAFLATDPDPTTPPIELTETAPVRFVLVEHIVPNPHQPRRQFEEAALKELADSIREHGILQPLLVRQIGPDRYELIAGERRLRAARMAGLTTVPVLVREMTDREQSEVALLENLQREDLSPVETARAFRTLMNTFGLTQQELGKRVSKSASTISELLRLLHLSEEILNSLERGEIQERHARPLLQITDKTQQRQLWQQIVAERLSVREIEKRVRALQSPAVEPTRLRTCEVGNDSTTQSQLRTCEVDTPMSRSLLRERARGPVQETRLEDAEVDALRKQLAAKYATWVRVRRYDVPGGHLEIGFHDDALLLRLLDILLNAAV